MEEKYEAKIRHVHAHADCFLLSGILVLLFEIVGQNEPTYTQQKQSATRRVMISHASVVQMQMPTICTAHSSVDWALRQAFLVL